MHTAVRRVARKIHYWKKGYPFFQALKQLHETERFSRQELLAFQDEKVARLIQHVYDSVLYYRRIMDERRLTPSDIRSVDDLQKLPVLTREELRRHSDEFISTHGSVGKPQWCRTGGTTGTPLRTANDLRGIAWGNAAYYRGLGWAGYELDRDRLAILFGGSLEPGRDVVSKAGFGKKTLSLSAFDVTAETFGDYRHALDEFRPQFLKGYSGSTYVLARHYKEAGIDASRLGLRALFTTSETQPPSQREFVESVFHAPVYSYYGSVEINSLGYQCAERAGTYHIPEEHVVIETASDDHELPEGAGSFVITDLDNYFMPLLRYRNGDAGMLSVEPCACGRALRRISSLYGRVSDFLRSTDGRLVYGGTVDYVLGDTHHIREYCLIQDALDLCRLLYIPDQSDSEIPGIVEKLQQFLGEDMRIEAEQVPAIPLTKSGKRRFTICKLEENAVPLPSAALPAETASRL